jgi:hypothetical protein
VTKVYSKKINLYKVFNTECAEVVLKPTDFKKILQRVENDQIETLAEFVREVFLVLANIVVCGEEKDETHKAATEVTACNVRRLRPHVAETDFICS